MTSRVDNTRRNTKKSSNKHGSKNSQFQSYKQISVSVEGTNFFASRGYMVCKVVILRKNLLNFYAWLTPLYQRITLLKTLGVLCSNFFTANFHRNRKSFTTNLKLLIFRLTPMFIRTFFSCFMASSIYSKTTYEVDSFSVFIFFFFYIYKS